MLNVNEKLKLTILREFSDTSPTQLRHGSDFFDFTLFRTFAVHFRSVG